MYLRVLLTISLMSAVLCGCHSTGVEFRARITGVGIEGKGGVPHAFVDLTDEFVQTKPVPEKLKVSPSELIETNDVLRLSIQEETGGELFDYKALVGAGFGTGSKGNAWVERSPPTLHVDGTWVFLWGRWPQSGSSWVRAATIWLSGSAFFPPKSAAIIQIVDSSLQRVFFVDGSPVQVSCAMSGSTTSAKLETPRTYIEVRKKVEAGIVDCDFGADPVKKVPGPTDPDPYEVRKNFEEMLRMATLADWP